MGSVHNIEKFKLLSSAHIFALTSYNENFGNVYLESLASGTPIISTLTTPWHDVKKNGCGESVLANKQDVSQAILRLMTLDQKVASQNAIKYASKFSWALISQKFYQTYQNLLY